MERTWSDVHTSPNTSSTHPHQGQQWPGTQLAPAHTPHSAHSSHMSMIPAPSTAQGTLSESHYNPPFSVDTLNGLSLAQSSVPSMISSTQSVSSRSVNFRPSVLSGDDLLFPAHTQPSLPSSWTQSGHYCPICYKKFASKQNVEGHFEAKHNGNKRYECSKCGKKFPYPQSRNRHERSKTSCPPAASSSPL
ncbi:hypothetical protein BT96DRAFT_223286 [Gymnopus androsaceus JB14]|uniref:C2H2-type domain-containing protein n=1 Tax=Gymnopus androsaceus JB14 TaxID=1447944 RepID=A0A6A4ICX8_9AGAR|nr:hypothetical protein BT96DRAFT_223286 [Gymnopus androsaceus JB14]